LLDAFQGWLSSSEIYNDYWGFSEDPKKTEEEFEKEQFQSLINRINRVPMLWEDSEAADRGTAFNEVVDCVMANCKSEKMVLSSNKEAGTISAEYNKRNFIFPFALIKEFSEYFKGGVSQVYTDGFLTTKYGDVQLYGYIDELLPLSVHDIKTTGKYKAGKFRNNWQHIVYPFCLNQSGNKVNQFEYNVAVLGANNTYQTFTEHYHYRPEAHDTLLINHIEHFINFIEINKNLITDKKLFNK
jgi:hypothetical protein